MRHNRIISIAAETSMILLLLLGLVKGTKPSKFFHIDIVTGETYSYTDIDTFRIQPNNFKVDELIHPSPKQFMLIKDFSSDVYTSPHTKDTIMIEIYSQEYSTRIHTYYLSTLFYTEVEKDGVIIKKCTFDNGRLFDNSKSIFIIPRTIPYNHVFLNRVKQAEENKNSSLYNHPDIKSAFDFLIKGIDMAIHKMYINYIENRSRDDIKNNLCCIIDAIKHSSRDNNNTLSQKTWLVLNMIAIENMIYKEKEIYKLFKQYDKELKDKVSKIVASKFSDKNIENQKEKFKVAINKVIMDMKNRTYENKDIITIKYEVCNEFIRFTRDLKIEKSEIENYMENKTLDQEIDLWNKNIQKTLLDRLDIIDRFSGPKEELIKIIAKEDIEVVKEMNIRKEIMIYKELRNLNTLIQMANGKIQSIINELFSDSDEIFKDNLSHEDDTLASKNLEDKIIGYLKDLAEKNWAMNRNNNNYIENTLDRIKDAIFKIENNRNMEQCQYAKKLKQMGQDIVDFIFKDINNGDIFMAEIKSPLKNITELLTNLLIRNVIRIAQKKPIEYLKNGIEKKEAFIQSKDMKNIFNFIMKEFENYNYKIFNWVMYWGVYPRKERSIEEDKSSLYDDLHKSSTLNEWILRNIKEYNLGYICGLYLELYLVNQYIDNLKLYDEIWKNPVFLLIVNKKNNFFWHVKPRAYIKDLIDKNGNTYDREIDLTDKNIEAFQNAKTMADVEAIGL